MRKQIVWFGMCVLLLLLFLLGQRVLLGAVGLRPSTAANAISTAFAYQGSLHNSLGAITGSCDLRLSLYAQASGGGAVAGPVTLNGADVQDGIFSVQVDFGAGVFIGDNRWLETEVRCPSGQGAFATLTPRQAINPAPYALYAADARQSLGDFTVQNDLWVGKTGIFGGTDAFAGISVRAPDSYLNADPFYERGAGGRALVHYFGNVLALNFNNDFAGGVKIGGSTVITGELTIEGKSLRLLGTDLYINAGADRGDGGRALVHAPNDQLVMNYENDFAGGVLVNDLRTGKIVEENLMTPAQRSDLSLLPFTQGEVLCWNPDAEELIRCTEIASPLVVAIADTAGKPIVLGKEPVLVTGPVRPGDLLVASEVAGHAVAWSSIGSGSPPAGAVIAKALEANDGASGLIQALIFMR
jgi:hypothetical protein